MLAKDYLLHALKLAQIRRGFCAPNPSVGAIVVKNDRIVAEGYHLAAGSAHAEVAALNQIDDDVPEGSTVYVTLEPCCHWGKTAPCTELLINKNVAKVVYGFADPNPVVAGKGARALREAGVECEYLPSDEINDFYRSYAYWQSTKRPFITAKIALSLDGKIADANGEPVSITGAQLQTFTHEQRKSADAILTTARTIKQDDPQLNVRLGSEQYAKPLYILDSKLSLSLDATIRQTAKSITLFHAVDAPKERVQFYEREGMRCVAIECDCQNKLALASIIEQIGADGLHDLWIEAGGQCFSAFAEAGLVRRAYVYVAPTTLGCNAYPAFSSANNIFETAKSFQWKFVGDDAVCKIQWYNP